MTVRVSEFIEQEGYIVFECYSGWLKVNILVNTLVVSIGLVQMHLMS